MATSGPHILACDLLLFACLYETPHLVSVDNMAESIDEDAFRRHQTCKAALLQLQSLNIKHAHHSAHPCLPSKLCALKNFKSNLKQCKLVALKHYKIHKIS